MRESESTTNPGETARGECNKLNEFLHRHHKVKYRSWSLVEVWLYAPQVSGGELGQISSLRHVLGRSPLVFSFDPWCGGVRYPPTSRWRNQGVSATLGESLL